MKVHVLHHPQHEGCDYFNMRDCEVMLIEVGTEDLLGSFGQGFTIKDVHEMAELMFAKWNYGSGQESDAFRAARIRSLSVGDVIVIPELETALFCDRMGWSQISLAHENVLWKDAR